MLSDRRSVIRQRRLGARCLAARCPPFTDHRTLSTVCFLLALKSDAARLLHLPRAVLRAGPAVGGDSRQQRRQPAAMLPAAWGAPLRHGHADGRNGPDTRSATVVYRPRNLPTLSRSLHDDSDAGSRAPSRAGQPTNRVDVLTGVCFPALRCALEPQPGPRRPRPSDIAS